MFNNSGEKIKIVAIVLLIVNIILFGIGAIIYAIFGLQVEQVMKELKNIPKDTITLDEIAVILIALVIVLLGFLISWVISLFITGFGDLIENSRKNAEIVRCIELKLNSNPNKISKETTKLIENNRAFNSELSISGINTYSNNTLHSDKSHEDAEFTNDIFSFTKIPQKEEWSILLQDFSSDAVIIPAEHNGWPVTEIARGAFFCNRNLSYVAIPNTIKEIKNEAFMGCTSLRTVQYNGTKEQWFEIMKYSNWDNKTGDYIVEFI